MSSLKMTFSLTSLILIIALVFATAPVMAHDTDADTDGDQPDGHVHHKSTPMVADADINLVSGLDGTVQGTEVKLVDDVDGASPVTVNPGTPGEFQVEIKFSEAVYAYTQDLTASPPTFTFPTVATAPLEGDLVPGDFTITAASREVNPGANLFGGSNITVAVARKAGATAGTFLDDTFLLTFTVPAAANPAADATATPPVVERLPIDVWITLNKDAVASQTKLVNGIETTGVANAASMRKMFTIVSTLTEAPAAPMNLVATAGTESVTLTWDPVTGASYEYKMDDGDWMDVPVADIGNLTVSSLTAGTAVMFSVRVKAMGTAPAGEASTESGTPMAVVPDPLMFDVPAADQLRNGRELRIDAATVGMAYSLTLPEAMGGTAPLTYSLHWGENIDEEVLGFPPRELPVVSSSVNNLSVNLTTRVFSGTPADIYWEWFTWRVTDSTGDSTDISFWLEVRPTAPVPIEVTGTLSLTQRSLVTFTAPADMPTRLERRWIDVDGGSLSDWRREDNPTAPRMHNTLWYAFFNPDPGAQRVKISVPDNAWVTPAATNSVLRFGGVTLMSIEPVGVANDTGPFVVELTFSGSVTSLKASDLMVTPMDDPDTSTVDDAAMIGDIAAVLGSDGKKWQVQITPVAGEATTIALASDSDIGMGTAAALTVKTKDVQDTETPGTPLAGDVTLAAKGDEAGGDYAVLVHAGATAADHGIDSSVKTIPVTMPNLYEFFRDSGTLVLKGPAGASAGSVKITEIMWGTDASLSNPMNSQWIEIQNQTAAADATDAAKKAAEVTVNFGSGWELEFKSLEYDPSPAAPTADAAGAVDSLSNLGNPGKWDALSLGSSGRTVATDTENQVELASMLRKLDKNAHKAEGWEKAGRPSVNLAGARIGNPGSPKPTSVIVAGASNVDRSTVYITEIGNFADGSDWLEIYNSTDAAVNIKNWIISAPTKAAVEGATDAQLTVGNNNEIDKQLFAFGRATYEDALNIPAKTHLLVTASDPANNDNPLAVGINLKTTKVDRDPKTNETTGLTHLYYIEPNLKIPNESHLLILRSNHEHEGSGSSIRDAVNVGDYIAGDVGAIIPGKWNTEVWPLQATGKPGDRESVGTSGVISKEKTDKPWSHKETWGVPGFTGLGYDRDISDSANTKGTPGYAHGAVKGKVADLASDTYVTISEIMVAHGNGRLPQWIELYNSSMTQAVGLNGWKLEVYNVNSDDVTANENLNATVTLPDVKILPNQTVLIVSATGRNSGRDHFPSHRIIDLWDGDAFGRESRLDPVLSTTGFNITLLDPDKKEVDQVGNIDNNRRSNDDPAWEIPAEIMTDDGRSSLIRFYGTKKSNPRGAAGYDMAWSGTERKGWTLAAEGNLSFAHHDDPYYGRADDIATPGFRGGGPLPVSLSKFRPERLESGEIVIRWITESELNNAGFNILRSDKRNGEFTKINTSLIAGHGTTSERNTYEWKDTSAKPNVVYYYQIQDVSLDGDVNILRQSRLKGDVSPAGKLTVTWGELKALQ